MRFNPDLEAAVRDLPGFTPAKYIKSRALLDGEIGSCEVFRLIPSADVPSGEWTAVLGESYGERSDDELSAYLQRRTAT